MSATHGAIRVEADNYPTPPEDVRSFLAWARGRGLLADVDLVVDPCAGEGDLLRVVAGEGFRVGAVELREECREPLAAFVPGGAVIGDALASPAAVGLRRALVASRARVAVVTNPPYGLAREFVATWAPAVAWSAWLLRLPFLETPERADWLRSWRPAHVAVLPSRPSFVAVCKGLGKTKTRTAVKGCGRYYPRGTRGRCECGGTIGDGVDATAYAWFVWPGRETLDGDGRLDWV